MALTRNQAEQGRKRSDAAEMYHSGTPEPYRREKGSGKTKCITLEANVRSVHFLGREESEPF